MFHFPGSVWGFLERNKILQLEVIDQPLFLQIYSSGREDNSTAMTQNTGEQTLLVVFGASVSDNFDIFADLACMTNLLVLSCRNLAKCSVSETTSVKMSNNARLRLLFY